MKSNFSRQRKIALILDGVKFEANIGQIFRLSVAFGVERIYMDHEPAHFAIRKTSAGSWHHVPRTVHEDVLNTVRRVRNRGYTIWGLDIPGDYELRDADPYLMPESVAIVLGSEKRGISDAVKDECDAIYEIGIPRRIVPMPSINVATATAIALYQITL